MQRRQFTAVALLPWWAGAGDAWALTESDAAAGIRDALRRAAGNAVASLGRNDGFLGIAQVRVGLPNRRCPWRGRCSETRCVA